jgi:hypothetical protein
MIMKNMNQENKGRPIEKKITTVVVYKKPTGTKYYMLVTEEGVDNILNPAKRKPLLPDNFEIIDIGMGESFIEKYKKLYKIK